jgi:hypothetical protein
MAMGSNGKQMTSYQWKQKTTVIRKGNPLEPMIDELRFDATGQIQRITLVKPEEKRMGPLRARKAAEGRMTVQIPKDAVIVNVESFDFVRLAGPVSF